MVYFSPMRHLPNLITLANLFCGCMAIVAVLNLEFDTAGILVLVATVLDFLDGFAARMLKAYSEIGKQLDSLADMVTFGVVPGLLLFQLFGMENTGRLSPEWLLAGKYLMLIVTLFLLCASQSLISTPVNRNHSSEYQHRPIP